MRYKVGDKVWIKSWEDLLKVGKPDKFGNIYFDNGEFAPFISDMEKFCGKKVEILDIEDNEYIIEGSFYINDLCIDFQADMGHFDVVQRPKHYADKEIEVIDYIQDTLKFLDIKGYEAYCWGNVIKYMSRYTKKNGVQDIEKAIYYIQEVLEEAKKREGK